MVNKKGILTVNEIINQLDVSDMTVRRDLDELEKSGKLLRVHGGAQSLSYTLDQELSHTEKATLQIQEKRNCCRSSLLNSRRRNNFFRTRYNNRTFGDPFTEQENSDYYKQLPGF